MKYTASMQTILTTTDLDIVKDRFAHLEEAFEEQTEQLDIETMIDGGNVLVQSTTTENAQVRTYLRIDCDRGEKPEPKGYPTADEVKAASLEQIDTWFRQLPTPLRDSERKVLGLIRHRRQHPEAFRHPRQKEEAKVLPMHYPTLAEVDQASREQIEDWCAYLRAPVKPIETAALKRIGERYRETQSQEGTRDPQL